MESGYIIATRTDNYTKSHYLCYDDAWYNPAMTPAKSKERERLAKNSKGDIFKYSRFIPKEIIKECIEHSCPFHRVVVFHTLEAAQAAEYMFRKIAKCCPKWCRPVSMNMSGASAEQMDDWFISRKIKLEELGGPDNCFIMKS